MNKQKFLESMIDFKSLQDKSDEEIAVWAQDKWKTLLETDYWQDRDNYPYVQLFVRYMKDYIPELNGASAESD
jgi:hypothetical protein